MAETLELLVRAPAPGLRRLPRVAGNRRVFRRRARCARRSRITASRRCVRVLGGRLLRGLPGEFTVGRYHSLHARRSTLPAVLSITAETADGVIMAIEHADLPIAAVQFHPELVMTLRDEIGMPIIAAVLSVLGISFAIIDIDVRVLQESTKSRRRGSRDGVYRFASARLVLREG